MSLPRLTIGLGCVGLVGLSVAYCLPHHPSAGNAAVLDVLLHIALFATIGLWFGWFTDRRPRIFILLALLAALLELAQWLIGGYPRIEVADIFANEAGLVLAWVLLQRRHMKAASQAVHDSDDKDSSPS